MKGVLCPSCKRKGTYSPKFEQCQACGLGYEATLGELPKVEKPVTHKEVTGKMMAASSSGDETRHVTSNGGRHCRTCTCGPPKTGAERQKEYRERKNRNV